jgi:hypothetical protein
MRTIEAVREHIAMEEFDYQLLMQSLRQYRKPRDAVTNLLRTKSIVRVKKGYYVFGERYRRKTICKESIANLIYGPSYISLEYALSYYGLIPERVERITSMTSLRSRIFQTPLGIFEYTHLHLDKISVGVTFKINNSFHQFLIATPEKALADRVAPHKNLCTFDDMHSFVCEGLRIEEETLATFHVPLLEDIEKVYKNPAVTALTQLVKEITC